MYVNKNDYLYKKELFIILIAVLIINTCMIVNTDAEGIDRVQSVEYIKPLPALLGKGMSQNYGSLHIIIDETPIIHLSKLVKQVNEKIEILYK